MEHVKITKNKWFDGPQMGQNLFAKNIIEFWQNSTLKFKIILTVIGRKNNILKYTILKTKTA